MKFVIGTLLVACLAATYGQKSGICGKVLWVEGNQMPGPDRKQSPGTGIAREIHVYELATRNQAEMNDGFFTEVPTRLVAVGKSKANGMFRVKLPPGEYSVFTREPDGLFANIYDQRGAINPVVVTEGEFTVLELIVNYKAAY